MICYDSQYCRTVNVTRNALHKIIRCMLYTSKNRMNTCSMSYTSLSFRKSFHLYTTKSVYDDYNYSFCSPAFTIRGKVIPCPVTFIIYYFWRYVNHLNHKNVAAIHTESKPPGAPDPFHKTAAFHFYTVRKHRDSVLQTCIPFPNSFVLPYPE